MSSGLPRPGRPGLVGHPALIEVRAPGPGWHRGSPRRCRGRSGDGHSGDVLTAPPLGKPPSCSGLRLIVMVIGLEGSGPPHSISSEPGSRNDSLPSSLGGAGDGRQHGGDPRRVMSARTAKAMASRASDGTPSSSDRGRDRRPSRRSAPSAPGSARRRRPRRLLDGRAELALAEPSPHCGRRTR